MSMAPITQGALHTQLFGSDSLLRASGSLIAKKFCLLW